MFHSKKLNNRIKRIQERSLRITYSDFNSSFDDLLEKDNSYEVHHKNIHFLAIEIYKFLNNLSPEIMKNIFHLNTEIPYNLRERNIFYSNNPKTVTYGLQSITYLSSKIWSIVPENIKSATSVSQFKTSIRKWKPKECPCRICKNYIQHVGFF